MSRAFNPPDTLTKQDIRTLGDVRRDIWSSAMVGGGVGAGSGLVLHTGAQWLKKLGYSRATLNRNTAMFSVLGGGAFGMFVCATATGKQEVHNLHSVFQAGAIPRTQEDIDLQKLEQHRVLRRRTMHDALQKGQGLSDSHGGQWFREER